MYLWDVAFPQVSPIRRFLEGVGFRINLLVIEIVYTATQMWSYVNRLVGRKVRASLCCHGYGCP
jgi:hypothetical protein